MPLFYRLTHSQQPTVDDFKSQAELATQGRPKLVSELDWSGVSLRPTLADAGEFYERLKPELKDKLGHFITELDLPDNANVKQTGEDPNHYSVWAPAQDLLGWSTKTEPAVPLQT